MLARLIANKPLWLMLLATAGLLGWHQYSPLAADQLLRAWRSVVPLPGGGLGLDRYRVSIDALPIAGVPANASGLAYNRLTGTLFMVVNSPPTVVELSTEGKLLRRLPVIGVSDLEGIAHMDGNFFALADERAQRIIFAHIGSGDQTLDVREAPQLTLAIDRARNRGFEGLAWDHRQQRLLVVKEQRPKRVIEIRGISPVDGSLGRQLAVSEWLASERISSELRDLSSIGVHEPSGHLLLLSDESKLLAEFNGDGERVGSLALRQGRHGLAADVRQPEGVEFDDAGNLYVVSEPNLFYRFAAH